MKKLSVALLALALVLPFSPAAAADEPGGTYLALGDSVAAGTQQPDPFTANGYADQLFKHLEDDYAFDNFVNLACPGDDTAEMRNGDVVSDGNPIGSLCYGEDAPLNPEIAPDSQLDAALDYLERNADVRLITIVIGANDILACDGNPACFPGKLSEIASNLRAILTELRSAAPGVPIVAMNYYNPNLAFWVTGPEGEALAAASLQLTAAGNGVLETVYGAFGVPVVDVATTFKTLKTSGGDTPTNVRSVCRWTLMCEKSGPDYVLSDSNPVEPGPQPDIHPSNKGHKKIAGSHADLIESLGGL